MLFNSWQYLGFFLLVLGLSWALVGLPKLRIWVMLLASYYFYTSNNHWLILLIFASTQIDYVAALAIDRATSQAQKKRWLWLSLGTNLGILAYFKYFNFFAGSVAEVAGNLGIELSWVDLNIALPVGISFYTFQSLSYTIDVYRGHLKPEKSWYRFAFFVAYFPQLIAGPIVRASEFLHQTHQPPKLSASELEEALYRIFVGLFKKIVLADFLAIYADQAFSDPASVGTVGAWIGIYAFALQIYFDFSGYTDIAIGCARLMGYRLPENFRQPYVAVSITDFWRRWHMSLSRWLRDYLYFSLGGNRVKTRWRIYRNLMITMLLGGLWHGAAWHFVIWGFLHGALLSLERVFGVARGAKADQALSLRRRVIGGLILFQVTVLLWIPFRAENNDLLLALLEKLTTFTDGPPLTVGMVAAVSLIMLAWLSQLFNEYIDPKVWWLRQPVVLKGAVYAGIFFVVLVFNSGTPTPFIYFRF